MARSKEFWRKKRKEPVVFNPLRRLVAAVLIRAWLDYLYPPSKNKNEKITVEMRKQEAREFLTDPEIMILLIDFFDIPEQKINEVLALERPLNGK